MYSSVTSSFPSPLELKEGEFTTHEAMNDETQNPRVPPSSTASKVVCSDPDWDSGLDDTYFWEATEDAELAEAAENSLRGYNGGVDEIPDELIVQVFQD